MQLGELEDPDLEKVIEIIMDIKIGEGLNFLPRTISYDILSIPH